jgi:hypothetical protein
MASDAIDTALVNYLAGDATLTGILTGGVHWFVNGNEAEPPFATVQLFTGKDVRELRRKAWEECRYLILVVTDNDIATARQACARIDALLDGGTFSISGYTLLKSERERRFAGMVQVDELDQLVPIPSFGGLYMIWAQAN